MPTFKTMRTKSESTENEEQGDTDVSNAPDAVEQWDGGLVVDKDVPADDFTKLFVGGLSWETTQDNLQRYFTRYGEVIDCVVMKNSETGRSRGFGFVTFADPNNIDQVLATNSHQLDGRTIDPKPCNPRSMQRPKRNVNYPKVFLGGLPSNVTETDLRTFFGRYGRVMEVVIMYDQEKRKSRGFGFLSFETDESVDRCVAEHFVNVNGKQVEIKKAEPRDMKMGDGPPPNQWGPPPGGPPMGMGGGMGPMGANGQMGGPMGPMGPTGGMMQSYQGWGTPPQQQGYPGQGPPGYQGWGAPPGPQGQQMPPPQWGANYGGPPQQQGYSAYADMYARQQGPGGVNPPGGPAPPGGPSAPPGGASQKPGTDYTYQNQYGSYPQQDASTYGGRGYTQDGVGQQAGYTHPPAAGSFDYSPQQDYSNNTTGYTGGQTGDAPPPVGGYAGGPGPQRGGNYSQPSSVQGFHPYRRM